MLMMLKDSKFEKYGVSKKDILKISDFLKGQEKVYKDLKLDLSNLSVYVVLRKDKDIEFIRVLDRNIAPVETFEHTIERVREISTSKKDFDNAKVFKCFYLDGVWDCVKVNNKDLINIEFKKVRDVDYAVTDFEDTVKVAVSLQDTKGAEYDILYKAVSYAYRKKTGKKTEDLSVYVVKYVI